MAEKRMFSKEIIDSDAFLDMPSSTQNLYFHLGMRADDDGFINSPNKIMNICKASKNDMDLLIVKNYVIPFESGVLVIKHWRINNYLRTDRYKPTNYQDEYKQLSVKENGSYQKKVGIPMVDQMETQYSIEKNSIDKVSLEEESQQVGTPSSSKRFVKPTIEEVAEYCKERKNGIDAEHFWHFYENKKWKVGKETMSNWKSCVITWEKRKKEKMEKSRCNEAKGKQYSSEELNSLANNLLDIDI